MGKPKRQHWVPCFYLRYFATPETRESRNPQVWALSKHEGGPLLTSIRNVAQQRYLYSPTDEAGNRQWDMETNLAEYEGVIRQVWPLLAEDFVDLHEDESIRKGLALFVALLYLRHPHRLAEIGRIHTRLVELYGAFPKDEQGRPLIQEVENNGVIRPFDNSDWIRYKTAGPNEKKQMFIDSVKQNAIHIVKILMQKRWSVVFSKEPVFITTDTPVAVANLSRTVFGLNTPGTVISFPLSPTRVLMMDDRHDEPKGNYYPLSDAGPGPANFSAWHVCGRFMISPRHTDVVCAEMLAWADSHATVN